MATDSAVALESLGNVEISESPSMIVDSLESLEICESPVKNPNVEDENKIRMDPVIFNENDIEDEELKNDFRNYFKRLNQSDCFDIDEVPKARFFGKLYPLDLNDKREKRRVMFWASYAIFLMNEEDPNKRLELVDVVRTVKSVDPCRCLFITFEAKDVDENRLIYRAKMSDHSLLHAMQLVFCRDQSNNNVIDTLVFADSDAVVTKDEELFWFRDEKQRKHFTVHLDQMKKSRSFPTARFVGPLLLVNLKDESDKQKVELCAKYALFHYTANEEEPTFEFQEIERAIQSKTMLCRTYFITFRAIGTMSRSSKGDIFYAQVFTDMLENYLKLGFCRDEAGRRVISNNRARIATKDMNV